MTATDLDPDLPANQPAVADERVSAPRAPSLGIIWWASFAVVFALLLFRSRWVFSTPVTEHGDAAANSLLANQAEHFELLVGNYSRVGFHHPGPALLYVEAFGQWLFHDVLALAAAPFNGQLIALYAFNAALVACTLLIVLRRTRSWTALLLALAAVVVYVGSILHLFSSNWMPYFYVAPFLLLVASASSVIAGRLRDVTFLVLASGLLVHGHIAFVLFVASMTGFVLIAFALRHRTALGAEIRTSRRAICAAGAVLAVFLVPMVANLALNWPGEFGRYLDYVTGETAEAPAPRTSLDVVAYVFHYWNGSARVGLLIAVVAAGGILALARTAASRQVRELGQAVVIVSLVATLLMVVYAAKGIDDVQYDYLGIFYRSVPLFTFITLAALIGDRLTLLPGRWGQAAQVGAGLVAVGALVFGGSGVGFASVRTDAPYVQSAVDAIESVTDPSDTIVVTSTSSDIFASWPEMAGTLLEAERRGLSMCVTQKPLALIMSGPMVCTPGELVGGADVFYDVRQPSDMPAKAVFSKPSDVSPDRVFVIQPAR